ncbi:unnamed protein product [Cylindrotheca closterium]|uniref:FAD dependent oxidoreductase domain-containing protein n=1 Tax=Cylindrotheca closterium TaxID=2856 RepID=A0AAD2GCP7_9STRA|nr:unnamed protein product [Cylindrotheca closterium]
MVPIPKIVIAGGGIVGNSIAYFLSKRQVPVTLIDPVGIAPCASGKAGGFLAKDWRDGTDLQELQRAGFELHQTLANELGASNIDYRRLTCQAVAVDASQQTKKPTKNRKSKTLEWVDHDGVFGSSSMGDKQTIAQVHPKKLCQELWKYSESQGSVLKIGKVVKVLSTTADSDADADADASEASSPHNIQLEDGSIIPADKFVIACGPWTEHARDWFPKDVQDSCWPVITGVKCHSVLVQAPKTLSEAVFFERAPCSAKSHEKEEEASNSLDNKLLTSEQLSSVEVYPRPDGDAYVNGFEGDEAVIPEEPGQEVIDPKAVQDLELALQQTSSMLEGLTSHTQQVCYWPETPDGMPILDCLDNNNDDDEAFLGGKRSIYVAAGHSVWGILQGPISGKAMSELILDGEASCIDLTPFQLERFMYDNDNDDGSSSSSSSSSSSDDEIY